MAHPIISGITGGGYIMLHRNPPLPTHPVPKMMIRGLTIGYADAASVVTTVQGWSITLCHQCKVQQEGRLHPGVDNFRVDPG